MIERIVLILLSVALLASMGGFFLYVPILPNVAVTFVLIALGGMFWLGVRVGQQPQQATISQRQPTETNQLSLS